MRDIKELIGSVWTNLSDGKFGWDATFDRNSLKAFEQIASTEQESPLADEFSELLRKVLDGISANRETLNCDASYGTITTLDPSSLDYHRATLELQPGPVLDMNDPEDVVNMLRSLGVRCTAIEDKQKGELRLWLDKVSGVPDSRGDKLGECWNAVTQKSPKELRRQYREFERSFRLLDKQQLPLGTETLDFDQGKSDLLWSATYLLDEMAFALDGSPSKEGCLHVNPYLSHALANVAPTNAEDIEELQATQIFYEELIRVLKLYSDISGKPIRCVDL
jgi:hypothetical protein